MENILRNIVRSEEKYKGHILDLRIDTVRFPSGSDKIREVIVHKSAAAVLPVNDKGEFLLVQQYRHAVDQDVYEIPAGLTEDGEDVREAAVRELQEEIGYRPGHMEQVAEFYSSPGYCTEKITLFYADSLQSSKLQEDDDEYIKVCRFSPEEAVKMAKDGRINDGKTLMAIYWYMAEKYHR